MFAEGGRGDVGRRIGVRAFPVAWQSHGALGQRPLPEVGNSTRTGDRCAPGVVVMRADASCQRQFVSVRLSVVPPKAIGSTVTAQNWQRVSVTSRQSRSVRFRLGLFDVKSHAVGWEGTARIRDVKNSEK